MKKEGKKKKVINTSIPNAEFIKWSIEKIIWYGSGITVWWKIRGCKDFLKWAKENGYGEYKEEL